VLVITRLDEASCRNPSSAMGGGGATFRAPWSTASSRWPSSRRSRISTPPSIDGLTEFADELLVQATRPVHDRADAAHRISSSSSARMRAVEPGHVEALLPPGGAAVRTRISCLPTPAAAPPGRAGAAQCRAFSRLAVQRAPRLFGHRAARRAAARVRASAPISGPRASAYPVARRQRSDRDFRRRPTGPRCAFLYRGGSSSCSGLLVGYEGAMFACDVPPRRRRQCVRSGAPLVLIHAINDAPRRGFEFSALRELLGNAERRRMGLLYTIYSRQQSDGNARAGASGGMGNAPVFSCCCRASGEAGRDRTQDRARVIRGIFPATCAPYCRRGPSSTTTLAARS